MLMHQHGRLDALYQEAIRAYQRGIQEFPWMAADYRVRIEYFSDALTVATRYDRLLRAERLGLLEEAYTPAQVEEIAAQYRELVYRSEGAKLTREEFQRRFPVGAP